MNRCISNKLFKPFESVGFLNAENWINKCYDGYLIIDKSNNPLNVYDLSIEKILIVVDWIKKTFVSSRKRFHMSSYGLKHVFENSENGFYISNGEMKGIFLLCGIEPYEGFTCGYGFSSSDINWTYQIKFKGDSHE